MYNYLASLLLLVTLGTYGYWQRSALYQRLSGSDFNPDWFQRLFRIGAMATGILFLNAISFLRLKGLDYEVAAAGEVFDVNGLPSAPSSASLLIGQLEVIGATLSLVALVWQAVKEQAASSRRYDQISYLTVVRAVFQSLLLPFWLATFGIGSIFGFSAGLGIKDVVRHAEVLIGPPLILSGELTLSWLIVRYMISRQPAS